MKRVIVIFLTVAMIASLFAGIFMVNAATGDEAKMYWDFENTTLADMKTNTDNSFYADGNVEIVSGGANGSASALKISGINSGNGQWISGLTPDTTYMLYYWAKWENRDSDAWPNVGVSNFGGTETTHYAFSNDWTMYSIDFTTGAMDTSAKVWIWTFGSGNVDFYIDDVVVVKKPTTDFEFWNADAGVPALLNTMPGYYSTNATVAAGGAESSQYCIKVTGVNSGNGSWINGLTPSTTYVLTYWAKVDKDASAVPTFGVQNFGGEGVSRNIWTSTWTKYSLEFTTGESNTSAQIWSWVFGEGNSEFYIDEVSLSVKQDVPISVDPMSAWNFESGSLEQLLSDDAYHQSGTVSIVCGGAGESSYCLKVSGAESGNGIWLNGLQPDTDYTISFDAKIGSWGGNAYPNVGVNGYDGENYQAENTFTESWEKYSLTFKTGTESTTAHFYTWIFGSGAVDLYLDNVTLSKATHVHEYTQTVTIPATCGAIGLMTYTCVCGYTYTEDIPITGNHQFENGVCTVCGANDIAGGGLELWNFEHNNLYALGTADGGDADGYYAVGDVSIVPGGADDTEYCLKISGAECGNGQWITDLKPDTEYTIIFWAKIDNWGGDAYPSIGVNGFDGNNYVSADSFTNNWTKQTLRFKTGQDSTSVCIYTWIFGSGTVDFYVDQVELVEGVLQSETATECVVQDPPGEKDLPVMKNADGQDPLGEKDLPVMKNADGQAFTFAPSKDAGISKAILPLATVSGILLPVTIGFVIVLLSRKKIKGTGRCHR